MSRAVPMSDDPNVTPGFECSLRAMPGCGYGLRQKILVGILRLDPSVAPRLERILIAARKISESSFYRPAWDVPSEAEAILKLIYLYFLLQQCVRIPVFEEYRLEALSSGSGAADATDSHSPRLVSYRLVLPYWQLHASKVVIAWMRSASAQSQGRPDLGGLVKRIACFGLPGTNAYPFLRAGWQQGIHCSQVAGRVIQFGLGRQSRWMDSSMTDRTSAISASLARRKNETNQLLGRLGLPVPKQIVVSNLQQARQAAVRLGTPVVIKPLDQEQGRGVSVGVVDDAELAEAFEAAAAYGPKLIVEEFCEGLDYRLTVFQDVLVKVMQRAPLSVVGDGRTSIEALLSRSQEEARQQQGLALSVGKAYAVDAEILRTLRHQGYGLDTVPPRQQVVALRRKANLSAGGRQTLVPVASVHPDNVRLAVSLTSLLRLDCCGIDLIIPDIRRSWLQVGCHVIELNAQPQIGVVNAPEVYGEILQQMLTKPAPSVQLILDAASSEPASLITAQHPVVQQLSAACASPVVVATSMQLWRDAQLIHGSKHRPGATIQAALHDAEAQSLILIMTLSECLARGLPTHRIDRIVCLVREATDAGVEAQLHRIRRLAPGFPLSVVSA